MAKKETKGPDNVLNVYKRKSETPLQAIERYVSAHPEYKDTKMTYAGRLDPMAEGVLVLLSGEKNKERETYTGLDKEYEFEFILGVDTDTHDLLGKIVSHSDSSVSKDDVVNALNKYVGTFKQKYPAYSSKVIDGVPMFDLARKGKISTIVMPEHDVMVSSITLESTRLISKEDFAKYIEDCVREVRGDFRQKEILSVWKKYFEHEAPVSFMIYKARVICGSGFYVRQLVSDVGKDLKTGAVTVSILRTRVGQYRLDEAVK